MAKVDAMTAMIDFLKQLMTVATGSIVVIAPFLDRFAAKANHRWTVKAALISFVVCIVASIVCMFFVYLSTQSSKPELVPKSFVSTAVVNLFLSLFSIVTGVIALTAFVCLNF